MARPPEIDDPVEAFRQANISAVGRIIERARQEADRNAARATRQNTSISRMSAGLLSKTVDAAMAHYGRTAKVRPSIRVTAPDTGGRPYHFGFTTVTKGQRASAKAGASKGSAKGAAAAASKGSAAAKSPKGKGAATKGGSRGRPTANTVEGAHQAYTERDAAVERDRMSIDSLDWAPAPTAAKDPGAARGASEDLEEDQRIAPARSPNQRATEPERDEAPDTAAKVPGPGTERGTSPEHQPDIGDENPQAERQTRQRTPARSAMDFVEAASRDRPGLAETQSEAAAQAYIEEPAKVARVRGTTSSFGTIGDTLEDRMAFWDLVNEHESSAGGRTQSRLVLELPHEADAFARHKIVRRFVQEFEEKGIPYWASIHEPTKNNDSRNFHAHVVFTDRPMAKMPHPDTGEDAWDFTVAVAHRDSTRHTRIRHPFRQNRDPEMRERSWVKKSRARFAEIVNDVMIEHKVGIRYDARSYKDMGLDVTPMAHVSRV